MKEKKNRIGHRFLRWLCIILFVLLLLGAAGIAGLSFYVRSRFEMSLPQDFMRLAEKGESPRLFIYHFSDRVNRIGEREEISVASFAQKTDDYISYTDIPEELIHAFISIEDKHFQEHRGVNWKRTLAATGNYLFGRSKRFGASTITQQLVKNMTGNDEISAARKLQEMLYARDLERRLDKSEIMELYLNVIHFSDNCDGIVQAARHYFSKEVGELTTAECAAIAAITNSPSYYNPIRHPEHNLQRRNLILSEMQKDGYLSQEECSAAMAEPLQLSVDESTGGTSATRSWYVDMVLEDVIDDLMKEYQLGRAMATHYVYSGGLTIDMAMDENIQSIAEEYYRTAVQMPKNSKGESAQSSLIIMDSRTGDILAVVGAVGEKSGDRVQNFATQTKRPPGSTIKPISVYAPALEQGLIRWSSVYDDVPVQFGKTNTVPWPRNATGVYRGLTNISYAIAHSTNTVAVRVLEEVGEATAYRVAKEQFHLSGMVSDAKANDCDTAALALGQLNYGVTLRELTAAYGVFADGGVYHPWRSYYRVLDRDGNVLLSNPDRSEVVLSEGNAAVMTKLLQGVIQRGTSTAVTLDEMVDCAGKSGTTNADGDRWFVGYTPDLVCGVWCGYEYPEPLQGKNLCTNIWNRVMKAVVSETGGKERFEFPTDLVQATYCRDSGKLLCEACTHDPRGNRAEVGWFVKGTEPTEFCDCHVQCEYDAVCGGVCHGNCPSEDRVPTALLRVDRHFPIPILVTDAQYTWGGDPAIMSPNEDMGSAYFAASDGVFHGQSSTKTPYNRSCCEHLIPLMPNSDWQDLYERFFRRFNE